MKKQATKAAKRGRPAKKTIIIDESPCSLDSLIEQQIDDGLAVPVKCPSRLSNKLVGKRIKVCLVSADPEDYYEYAS